MSNSPSAPSPVPARREERGGVGVDAARVRALRVMKVQATALLVLAAAGYLATYTADNGGAGWVGFARAGAEAGMVGGLADWFAVTALFRHPLGLPIPHTALIPNRKDDIGRSLQSFVGTNFLAEDVVRARVAAVAVPQRLGRWLADPLHARRVSDEAAVLGAAALRVVRDADVQSVLTEALEQRLQGLALAPALGRVLEPLLRDGAHHRLVDVAVTRLHAWLVNDREQIIAVIARQAPDWSPQFLDRRVATRLHTELVTVAAAVEANPQHQLRVTLDAFLLRLAGDLRTDPATIARSAELLATLVEHPQLRAALGDLLSATRQILLELVEEPEGTLRTRLTAAITAFGTRLVNEPALGAKLDQWLGDAAGYAATHYREEITNVISDTIARWDGEETARRLEVQVGRDLQFIRINGTVVGALAGLIIHAVSLLV